MSKDREFFEQDLRRNSIPADRINLAIYFQTINRSSLKQRVDLIEFKKQIANEFLKTADVANPIIVNEVVKQKKINVENLEGDTKVLTDLSRILTNNLFMVAKVSPSGYSQILVSYKVYNNSGKQISSFDRLHSADGSGLKNLAYTPSKQEYQKPDQVAQSDDYFNAEDYGVSSSQINDDTFGHFSPTAFLAERDFYLENSAWFSSISKVSAAIKNLRFSYRYEIVQLDLDLKGSDDGVHHSSYALSRVQITNQNNFPIPLNLVFGIRGRMYRNEQNIDFVKIGDKKQTEENRDLDRLSLFLASSYTIEPINSIINFYIDNLKITTRFRTEFPHRFSVAGDLVSYRYDGDEKDKDQTLKYSEIDAAVTGQYSPLEKHSFFLTFQYRTEQFIFGYKGNF